MTTTVREIIQAAMRKVSIIQPGEVPTDSDLDISVESMAGLIDSWSNDRLMIYTINPYYFVAVPSQQEYTLGPGGDWDIERPMQIQEAYVNYNSQITGTPGNWIITNVSNTAALPIAQANDSQWASIPIKQLTAVFPTIMYDNGNYPLRTIYLYPIPTQYQVIALWLWQPLDYYDTIDDQVAFPPGYERALIYNLAVELAPEFGKLVPEDVLATAINSKMTLAAINSSPQTMSHDRSLGQSGSVWNWIYGDTVPIPH
jgi:hypothetical protein